MDKKIKKSKFKWTKAILPMAGLVGALFLFTNMYRSAGVAQLNVNAARIMIDTVHTGTFEEYIPLSGTVMPIKTIFLDAVEGGRVEEKFVEDGAMVRKGDVLLKLSNPDLLMTSLNQEANVIAQINQLRNTSLLMEQQSLTLKEQALNVDYQIDLTNTRLVRNRQLHQDAVIAKVELDEMETEYKNLLRRKELLNATIHKDSMYQALQQQQMTSSLDLMERNLTITRQNLDNLLVKAPLDGQLSGFNVEVGELVNSGDNIASIDKLDHYKIQINVDEFYIARVFPNQSGTLEYNGQTYQLKIKKIYPQVNNGSFLVDMVFDGAKPEGIRRGQSINLRLELSAEKESQLIARGAFYQTTGGNWVYVYNPNTQEAIKREVRLGNQNPSFYEVLDGLSDGELVITSSYTGYEEKDLLKIE